MEQIFENMTFGKVEILEAKEKGEVIGRVKGSAFFSDGYSRNGRFYPAKLWENALKNPQTTTKIKKGLMFGCIGHPKDYTLDELLESGKVSHKVVDIKIDPKTGEGIAEYEILDTPSGRILNTILRSGSEMYVSTRAFGGFTSETKTKDGKTYKVLDEKSFELESIDFVIEPGFLQTNPKLYESIHEDLETLFEDRAKIECSEGICQLREDYLSINESVDVKDEIDEDMFANIGDLSKEDIISILRNVVSENKILTANKVNEIDDTDNSGTYKDSGSQDIKVDAKLLSNYVAYVELLTKMVRYNSEFEKFYEDLIVFLDKNDKLSTKDMEEISNITESILKEKDIDESLKKICKKIQTLTKLLNDDAEENDKEEKEKTASESVIDFMFTSLTKKSISESSEKVLLEAELNTLKSQIVRLKAATISLSEQALVPVIKEVEVEKVVEKIVSRTPKEITEKLIESKSKIEALTAENETLREDLFKATDGSMSIVEELNDKVQLLEDTIEENLGFAREIKIEDDLKIKELSSKVVSLDEDLTKQRVVSKGLKSKLEEARQKANSANIGYLASVHRIEKSIVEGILTKAKSEKEVKILLEKASKDKRKSVPIVTETIDYAPNSRNEAATSRISRLIG